MKLSEEKIKQVIKKVLKEQKYLELDKRLSININKSFVDFYLDKKYIFRLNVSEIESILKYMKTGNA